MAWKDLGCLFYRPRPMCPILMMDLREPRPGAVGCVASKTGRQPRLALHTARRRQRLRPASATRLQPWRASGLVGLRTETARRPHRENLRSCVAAPSAPSRLTRGLLWGASPPKPPPPNFPGLATLKVARGTHHIQSRMSSEVQRTSGGSRSGQALYNVTSQGPSGPILCQTKALDR